MGEFVLIDMLLPKEDAENGETNTNPTNGGGNIGGSDNPGGGDDDTGEND